MALINGLISYSVSKGVATVPSLGGYYRGNPFESLIHNSCREIGLESVSVKPENIPILCKLEGKYPSLLKQCQEEVYSEELLRIWKGKSLHSTSSFLSLALILGGEGILRLGGKACRAKLPYD